MKRGLGFSGFSVQKYGTPNDILDIQVPDLLVFLSSCLSSSFLLLLLLLLSFLSSDPVSHKEPLEVTVMDAAGIAFIKSL